MRAPRAHGSHLANKRVTLCARRGVPRCGVKGGLAETRDGKAVSQHSVMTGAQRGMSTFRVGVLCTTTRCGAALQGSARARRSLTKPAASRDSRLLIFIGAER